METELKPEWGREMKRAATTLAILPDGIWKNKKFIREPMVCIFFKYLLGTFHVLKTLASLKISRAFLFKYSMCVGQPRFPHLPWWWTSCLLMTCHAKKKNSWGIVQFSCIRQLFQLQKFLYVLKIAWGNYQLSPQRSGMTPQITLEKVQFTPLHCPPNPLFFSLCYLSSHTQRHQRQGAEPGCLIKESPWRESRRRGKIQHRSGFCSKTTWEGRPWFHKDQETREDGQLGTVPVAQIVKNWPASARDTGDGGSIPGSGRSLGEGNGNLLQYPCLENSMDRGA